MEELDAPQGGPSTTAVMTWIPICFTAAAPDSAPGRAKAVIGESVRGTDVFVMVDVMNYSIPYTVAVIPTTCRRMTIFRI